MSSNSTSVVHTNDPSTAPGELDALTECSPVTRRHTDVSFPARVPVDKVHNLRVQVVAAEEVTPTGEVRPLRKPHSHDATLLLSNTPGHNIRLSVSVTAENFDLGGPPCGRLDVPPAGPSAALTFPLRGLEVGPGRVMVDFAQDGRPVGSVDLFPEVIHAYSTAAVQQAAPVGVTDFTVVPAGPAPDVTLLVYFHQCAGQPGRLQFVLDSALPALADLPVRHGDVGTRELRADLADWVAGHLADLSELACTDPGPDAVAAALDALGATLFDQLLPDPLKALFWEFRRRGVASVLVLSDDPHIPWELVKPFRTTPDGDVEADDFWGASFALTHWLRGRPPAGRLSLRKVLAMAAGGGDTPSPVRDLVAAPDSPPAVGLPSAAAELAMLRSLAAGGAEVDCRPALRRHLLAAFATGEFTALHVASHGSFDADRSAVQLEDGRFLAADLSPLWAGRLRRLAPLVFLNCCHTGRRGFALTAVGGWGGRLVAAGCGAFVGAMWAVGDQAALCFAGHFYRALAAGTPIGEAVRLARLAVRAEHPGDPTWLAYACFADPAARLG